ncbi:MAG: hypothetical protein AAF242_07840, partial [Bacteroidota bacterium]
MAGFGADALTENFYLWEARGRGWLVFDEPVDLEPPFVPFIHSYPASGTTYDDGLKTTFWGKVFGGSTSPSSPEAPESPTTKPIIPYPHRPQGDIHEVVLIPPQGQIIKWDLAQFLLSSLANCSQLLSFEIIGTNDQVYVQLACRTPDLQFVISQCQAYFPDTIVKEATGLLYKVWQHDHAAFPLDLALEQEWMRPLSINTNLNTDLLAGVIGALEYIQNGQLGMLQILFQGARNKWSEHSFRSVTTESGKPFFPDAPEMIPLTKQKGSSPLLGAVIRIIGQDRYLDGAMKVAGLVKNSLGPLLFGKSNALVPAFSAQYPLEAHVMDVFERRSRRLGMLLSTEELASLIHIPSQAVASKKLLRQAAKSKAAPYEA